ncbi:MAG: hypothetical protein M0R18_06645 [Deltaproteobacteria bacterium]|jgi:hypothetical protein|nr:hypothetical protein [Deltaproteobacteria bacterium]MDX9761178.1 hypothetical protein [Desulfomonilia bacterium]
MKTRDPYQIIIMRATGERSVMTIRSFWVRIFLSVLVALTVVLVVLVVWLAGARGDLAEAESTIEIQSGELKDLNLLLTRKDEEIITLKKKLSLSTIYQSHPESGESPAPRRQARVEAPAADVFPPIAGIKELALSGGELSFKVENVRPPNEGAARGRLFVVFRKQDSEVCHPMVKMQDGIPVETNRGLPFTIRNFKPMNVPVPPAMADWESMVFYIFDDQGRMRLSMPLDKKQIAQETQ